MKIYNKLYAVILMTLLISCASLLKINESKAQSIRPDLTVYKSASCGCCVKWIDHIEHSHLSVDAVNVVQLNTQKDQYNVPVNHRSCHTAVSQDGFVFEGHIPAKFIKQFLQEKPTNQMGLVVPGMPVGSPGMEYQNKFSPYVIMSFDKEGTLTPYAEINHYREQF